MRPDAFTRYWFELDERSAGYGVTGYDREDAEALLRRRVFADREMPPIRDVVEHVDVSALDPKHVLPNAGSPALRGVWYPHLAPEVER